jgi:hypothetical protein
MFESKKILLLFPPPADDPATTPEVERVTVDGDLRVDADGNTRITN